MLPDWWLLLAVLVTVSSTASPECSFYCFIQPNSTERVDFSVFANVSCTHFVYGYGRLTSGVVVPPSREDEGSYTFAGNFFFINTLRRLQPKAKILYGVEVGSRDSVISSASSREKAVSALANATRDAHMDGLLLLLSQPFLGNPRLTTFLRELSSTSRSLVVGLPLRLIQDDSLNHLVEAKDSLSGVILLPDPSLRVISALDPLIPSKESDPEETILFNANALETRGIPKSKIVIGLSSGAVVYKNFLSKSVKSEAEGRFVERGEICKTKNENELVVEHPLTDQFGKKIRWVNSVGYGGMWMSLSMDDPHGACGSGTFPLVQIALSNFECIAVRRNVSTCTRLCYVGSPDFPFAKLPPKSCSHIVIDIDLSSIGDLHIPSESEKTMKAFREWRQTTHDAPALFFSLGGRQTSDIWRIAVTTGWKRATLVRNLKELIEEWHADGVEVSWTLGSLEVASDPSFLNTLLSELRSTLGSNRKLALGVTHFDTYTHRYDVTQMNKTLDYLILYSHRFHQARQPFTGHHSPLFYDSTLLPDPRNTVESLVHSWSTVIGREKIVMGVTARPLVMPLLPEERSPSNPFLLAAQTTNANSRSDHSVHSYNQVCEIEKRENIRKEFLADIGIPFMITEDSFIAYDNERSMQMKTVWSSREQLGGVAFFSLDSDNVDGSCPEGRPFPLLTTVASTQVCERCIKEELASPCSHSFTVSCSYRLPNVGEADPLMPSRIPFERCTEIVVEEAVLRSDGSIEYRDSTATNTMKELSKLQPRMGMKRLITSIIFSMTQEQLKTLISDEEMLSNHIIEHMDAHGFSGVQLKFDHLLNETMKEQMGRFLLHLKERLSDETPPRKCIFSLSLRIPVWRKNLTDVYDAAILNQLNHVVLEPFNDPHGNVTHLNSPLFASNGHVVDISSTIGQWTSLGVNRHVILLLVPSYATTLTIAASNKIEIGMSATEPRVLSQAQVCPLLSAPGATKKFLWDRVAVYATSGDKWIAYHDQDVISYKVFYAIREGLGGIGMLSLNEDDWRGSCGSGSFPLLTASHARCRT